jgi:hypothetical protein
MTILVSLRILRQNKYLLLVYEYSDKTKVAGGHIRTVTSPTIKHVYYLSDKTSLLIDVLAQ